MTDPSGASDVPDLDPPAGAVSERMRALLSRAVDEQVQEQRGTSAVLQDLRGQVAALAEALARTASGAGVERVAADLHALAGDLAALREEVGELAARVEATAPTGPDEVAAAVAPRVAERLVEGLAPRVADVVLSRLGPALVEQLAAAVGARVLADVTVVVRGASVESERRVLAHVDEAVLALADALLRRRRARRPAGEVAPPVGAGPLPLAPPPAVRESTPGEAATAVTSSDEAFAVADPADTSAGSPAEPDTAGVAARNPSDAWVQRANAAAAAGAGAGAGAADRVGVRVGGQVGGGAGSAPAGRQEDAAGADGSPAGPGPAADVFNDDREESSGGAVAGEQPPPLPVAPPALAAAAPASDSVRRQRRVAAREAASADFGMPEILPVEEDPSTEDPTGPTEQTPGATEQTPAASRGDAASGARSPVSTASAPPFNNSPRPRNGAQPAAEVSDESGGGDEDDASRRRPWWRPGN